MANWSGTYSISAGATGTATGATSNTLSNSGASFPTVTPTLVNFIIRILTGTGAGQTRTISSNTATQVTVSSPWSVTPDTSSTYEIVLQFQNNDHVTGSITFSTNIITEIADNATVLMDGNFSFTFSGSTVTVRWGKTESTFVTIQPNNESTAGKIGFWGNVSFNGVTNVSMKWVKFIGGGSASGGFSFGNYTMDPSQIGPIWWESHSQQPCQPIANLTTTFKLSGFFMKFVNSGILYFPPGTGTLIYDKMWAEECLGMSFLPAATFLTKGVVRDTVIKRCGGNSQFVVPAGCEFVREDMYEASSLTGDGNSRMGPSNTSSGGKYRASRNHTLNPGRFIIANVALSPAIITSQFNTYQSIQPTSFQAITCSAQTNNATLTSDNDYISGCNQAALDDIDVSAANTSTQTPNQYQNLTAARTNPRNFLIKPLNVENAVVGTPTESQVNLTYDCKNGATAVGAVGTLSAQANSGQNQCSISGSPTWVEVGEVLELGYGTVNFESARVSTYSGGVVTFETNLLFTHAAGSSIQKQLRHFGLPFIKYGTVSGDYDMATRMPSQDKWGPIFVGWTTIVDGETYAWKKVGQSVTLKNLKPSTTYFALPCFFTPLGELATGTEVSFTTAASTAYTDPGVSNVRNGTAYKFNNATETGTSVVPTTGQVKVGTTFDNGSVGTYDGSDRWTDPGASNVKNGITYKANSPTDNQTGNVTIPTASQVQAGVVFDSNNSQTGTNVGQGSNSDPGVNNVTVGVNYEILGQNLTGTRQIVTNIIAEGTLEGPSNQAAILEAGND